MVITRQFWYGVLATIVSILLLVGAASCGASNPSLMGGGQEIPTTAPAAAATDPVRPTVKTIADLEAELDTLPTAMPRATSVSLDEQLASYKFEQTAQTNELTGTVKVVYKAPSSLDYPAIVAPDIARQIMFPDVQNNKFERPALVAYEESFESGDFCDSTPCSVDIPQWYARIMTAGQITIPGVVDCVATDTKGCAVIIINEFGETTMFRNATIDHGFTVAGLVFNMEKPANTVLAGQALLDHYAYRMLSPENGRNFGANCGSTPDGCDSVEWHFLIIGNDSVQQHWAGIVSEK